MTRRSLAPVIVALVLLAVACGDSSAAEEFEFAEEPTEVVVATRSGDVSVTANSRSGTRVDATATYSSTRPSVSVAIEGGRLVVGDDCITECSVDYVIRVGDEADVSVDVGTGDVTISQLTGSITVVTGVGDVNLNTTEGPLRVESTEGDILGARLTSATAVITAGDGSIDVTFDNVVDELTVESGSGDVTAQVPNAPYRVDATTGDGSIDVQVDEDASSARSITISTDRGDVTVYRK